MQLVSIWWDKCATTGWNYYYYYYHYYMNFETCHCIDCAKRWFVGSEIVLCYDMYCSDTLPMNCGSVAVALQLHSFCHAVWAHECCRISPPHFLAQPHKRRLNRGSFLLYLALFAFSESYLICVFSVFKLSTFPYFPEHPTWMALCSLIVLMCR